MDLKKLSQMQEKKIKEPIGVAIAGLGFGESVHLKALEANPEFELISVLTSGDSNYLDTNCEPNERYFYKIEVEDIFGNIFNSDTQRPSFGTCTAMEDSLIFDKKIQSVSDLVQLHIQDEFETIDSYTSIQPILQLLQSNIVMNHNWFERFPLELLKPSASIVEVIYFNQVVSLLLIVLIPLNN